MASVTRETLAIVDKLMIELVEYQEKKAVEMARRIHPGVTSEDIRNPQDFPDLRDNPQWNFEDGILSGYKSAHMALRAKMLELLS